MACEHAREPQDASGILLDRARDQWPLRRDLGATQIKT
jgi:hypothetical protein